MAEPLKLLCVFAHPDDESLGVGSTLARYAAEGVYTALLCATRGERGWFGLPDSNPGMQALGRIREAELRCAAAALGLREVRFMDYIDGEVEQVNLAEAAAAVAAHVRRIRPQVVITFGLEGTYGHPDHIAVAQITGAAVLYAADPAFVDPLSQPAHRVSKFYYAVDSEPLVALINRRYGGISMEIDGQVRRHVGWPEWAFTAVLDNRAYIPAALQAIRCHRSQVDFLGDLDALTPAEQFLFMGQTNFIRAFSLVNAPAHEEDLFAGLRESGPQPGAVP